MECKERQKKPENLWRMEWEPPKTSSHAFTDPEALLEAKTRLENVHPYYQSLFLCPLLRLFLLCLRILPAGDVCEKSIYWQW